jgi:hypothetical protein
MKADEMKKDEMKKDEMKKDSPFPTGSGPEDKSK